MIDSVLAFPNHMSSGNTVYTRDLYAGLSGLNIRVKEYNRYIYRSPSTSCFHFHWPDRVTGGFGRYSLRLRERAVATFRKTISAYQAAKRPVFWTVHNEQPHDFRGPEFARTYEALMDDIFGSIDGFIFLSEFSRSRFIEANPGVSLETCVVIPQMLPDLSGVSLKAPPELNKLTHTGNLFLIPGQIRTHKSIPQAIAIYQSIWRKGDFLVIAGPPSDRRCLKEIVALSTSDPSILIIPRALSDEEMLYLYERSKAVFALNAGTKNSAVLFTALSRRRRVIVGPGPVRDEMAGLFGNDMLVSTEFSPEYMRRILEDAAGIDVRPELSIEAISRRHLSFFARIESERLYKY